MPRLPTEVWLNIFEWAVFVPNALDTHTPDWFAYPGPWTHEQIRDGIRESLRTKCSIVLVCRAWKAIATRLLYEIVRLTGPSSLCQLLDLTARVHSPSEKSNARWVRRLNVDLECGVTLPVDDFMKFLSRLPSLQIIVMRGSFLSFEGHNQHLSLFEVLKLRPVASLKLLDLWAIDAPCTNGKLYVTDIDGTSVRHLTYYPWASHRGGQRMIQRDSECLQNPSDFVAVPISGELPAGLQYRLMSLEMDYSDCIPREFTTLILDKIGNHCPDLHSLIFNLHIVSDICFIHHIPSVKKLGFRISLGNDDSDVFWAASWKQFCASLVRLTTGTPSLKVIRVIDGPLFEETFLLPRIPAGVRQQYSERLLSKHGVYFKDPNGRLYHNGLLPSDPKNSEMLLSGKERIDNSQ